MGSGLVDENESEDKVCLTKLPMIGILQVTDCRKSDKVDYGWGPEQPTGIFVTGNHRLRKKSTEQPGLLSTAGKFASF